MEVSRDKSPFLISYPGWTAEGKIMKNNIKHINNMSLPKDRTETKQLPPPMLQSR